MDGPLEETEISTGIIKHMIHTIQSKATTSKEQAVGYFTRKKLKTMSTWDLWNTGERKQLNQFHDLQMFGKPILLEDKANHIILRLHWQYSVK